MCDGERERRTASALAAVHTASAPLSLSTHTDAQCTDTVTQGGSKDGEVEERENGGTEADNEGKQAEDSVKNSGRELQPLSNVIHHAAWKSWQYKYHFKGFK